MFNITGESCLCRPAISLLTFPRPEPGHRVPGDGGHDLPRCCDAGDELAGGAAHLGPGHGRLQPGGETDQTVLCLLLAGRRGLAECEREGVDPALFTLLTYRDPLPLKYKGDMSGYQAHL